jgi:hypothetical protein
MKKEKIIKLSTTEFIDGLKEAGYSKKARLFEKSSNDKRKKSENMKSIPNSKDLNRITDDIGKSGHYVRFECSEKEMRIHSIDSQTALIERIH